MFDEHVFIRHFVISTRLGDAVLKHLLSCLFSSPDLLLGVFLACSSRFSRRILSISASSPDDEYTKCAKAVRHLRAAGLSQSLPASDLLSALVLGLGVVTFDLLDKGMYAHSVARFTLDMAVKTQGDLTETTQGLNSEGCRVLGGYEEWLLPLIFLDTCNCIVRRALPVHKVQGQDMNSVDRYIGLCTPLLAYMYDICLLSTRAVNRITGTTADIMFNETEFENTADALESTLTVWDAVIPEECKAEFSLLELSILKTQADIYRLANLLLLHHTRFPYRCADEAAHSLSASILESIDKLYNMAQCDISGEAERRVVGVTAELRLSLPFLVAAVEVIDAQQRITLLERLEVVVNAKLYPHICEMLRDIIIFVWTARDKNCPDHLFELVLRGPSFVLF
jgi:hypothetical protein